jgi:hypothetical protein
VESKPVDRGHCGLSRLEAGMNFCQKDHCVNVIRVHVSENPWGRVGERVNLGGRDLLARNDLR